MEGKDAPAKGIFVSPARDQACSLVTSAWSHPGAGSTQSGLIPRQQPDSPRGRLVVLVTETSLSMSTPQLVFSGQLKDRPDDMHFEIAG